MATCLNHIVTRSTHTHVRTRTLARSHASTQAHTHTHTRSHTHTHALAHTRTRSHAHARAHARTHTRTRTHTSCIFFVCFMFYYCNVCVFLFGANYIYLQLFICFAYFSEGVTFPSNQHIPFPSHFIHWITIPQII